MSSKRKNHKGFTLLELILVMFLITLMMGLSAVYFAGFLPSVKVNAAARDISATIRHARALARLSMENRTVLFDLDQRAYGISGTEKKYLPPETVLKVIDPVSGEITQGEYAIVLHPTGGTAGESVILSRGKQQLRIELNPITGATVIKGGR